jgi:hypothetical protein
VALSECRDSSTVGRFLPTGGKISGGAGVPEVQYFRYCRELLPIWLVYTFPVNAAGGARRSFAPQSALREMVEQGRPNGGDLGSAQEPALLAVPLCLGDSLTAGAIAPRSEAKQLYVLDQVNSQPFAELRRHCANQVARNPITFRVLIVLAATPCMRPYKAWVVGQFKKQRN